MSSYSRLPPGAEHACPGAARGLFYLWRRRLVDKHRARRPRSSRTLSGGTPGSRAKSAATSRSSKISAFCAGKKLDAKIESQHQWRGEKRVLSRASSRGGSTRGVPSAVIATRAKSVAPRAVRQRAELAQRGLVGDVEGLLDAAGACDRGQTDRRVDVTRLHPGLAVAAVVENCNREILRALHRSSRAHPTPSAVAGDDQHAAIGLGQREAEPDHRGPHARGYPR
jgi:hypothetical protein